MKRLMLLRHAKTVPADPGIEDRERELVARGREDATAIGRYMAKSKYLPDLIVSSTSRRTIATVELLTAELPGRRAIDYVEALYLAAPLALMATIRGAPEKAKVLLVVGHNPGIERLAALLAREPIKRKKRDRVDISEEKFPTAALAVMDFDVACWREVASGQGEMIDFVRPRDL